MVLVVCIGGGLIGIRKLSEMGFGSGLKILPNIWRGKQKPGSTDDEHA